LTNENEKKEESSLSVKKLVRQFGEMYETRSKDGEATIADLKRQYDYIMSLLPSATGETWNDLIFKKRFLATQMMMHYDMIVTRTQAYLLALYLSKLEGKLEGLPERTSAQEQDQFTKAVDQLNDKLSKTLSKLFEASRHEAMHGAT
jgi:hypothetical protein